MKEQMFIPTGLPGGFFVYEYGGEERIVYADENVVNIYDCATFEEFMDFTGGSFKGMVHPEDLNTIQNQIQAQTMFGEKRHDYVRYRIITKWGKIKYIEDFGHLLHGANGQSYFYVFIVDVNQNEFFNHNRNSYAEAEVLSMNHGTDTLTGLFNMPFFYQAVQAMLSNPAYRRKSISFIHFDLPNFKLFNERNGFKAGDELLCDIARIIRTTFPNDIVSRFSDDHFVVCATGDREEVISMVNMVCRQVLHSKDASKRVRIKAGLYFSEDMVPEVGLACDHARLACNSIKHHHDKQYRIYDEMLRESLRKQQYVADHMEVAISNGFIKVFYQPVVRVRTGEICGFEALVRWVDPNLGVLPPADFISTLEQFHMIHKLDIYVAECVCRRYTEVRSEGRPLVPVSINLSRLDFELCDIFGIIESIREKYDVPRNMIDIEITESVLHNDSGHIRSECEKMRELGYQIWLDDFGSGYSSLNSLVEYSFDVLKLDMLFLRSFDKNPKAGILMTKIVEGARDMGLKCLCEGVESEEHWDLLKKIGCEKAQGYYFGKPLPYEEARQTALAKGMVWETR